MSILPISYYSNQSIYNKSDKSPISKPQISEKQVAFKGLESNSTETAKNSGSKILTALTVLGATILSMFGFKSPKEEPVEANVDICTAEVEKPALEVKKAGTPLIIFPEIKQEARRTAVNNEPKCTTYTPVIPGKNHFPGYRLSDESIDYKKFTQFLIDTKRAPLTRENSVVKKMIDFLPTSKIETLPKDYPLFTQYFLNALEHGFADFEYNIDMAMDYTYSDPSLIGKIEKYLEKGFKFDFLASFADMDKKVALNANLPAAVKTYSLDTQYKYIEFLMSQRSSYHTGAMGFVLENIPGEEFLLQCLTDEEMLDKISKCMAEAVEPFYKRSASTACPLKFQDLSRQFSYDKVRTELTLMKMKTPEKYTQLVESPEFQAVLWNKKTNALNLLDNIRHDLPITPTSIAGLEVPYEVMKLKYTESEIEGDKAKDFSFCKSFSHLEQCLPDYAETKGFTYRVEPQAGGKKVSLVNASGKTEIMIYSNGSDRTASIGKVEQVYFNIYGEEEARVTYVSAGNVFTVKTASGVETLNSYKDFSSKYKSLSYKMNSALRDYIYLNDDGFQTRKLRNDPSNIFNK